MKWVGNVARMTKTRNVHSILDGESEGKNHSEDLEVEGNIILEWVLGKQGEKLWTGCICLRTETSGRFV
jgi:hypothetical protein